MSAAPVRPKEGLLPLCGTGRRASRSTCADLDGAKDDRVAPPAARGAMGAPIILRRRQFALAGAAALAAGAAGCSALPTPSLAVIESSDAARELPPELQPPPAPREFRAAWVASVANIDWPSRPGLPNATWRAEALAILDRAKSIGLNAIVLQVRPAADALYASALEPWSEYLTGAQGRAPAPGNGPQTLADDPLWLWVSEAHRRGLELHAWFNPYRARHTSARSALAPQHIASARAHAVKRYGDLLWMDPAEPDAAAQTLAVVADVVRRYDIDGVHIDDYFYPYPIKANAADSAELPFPDEPAWQRYRSHGGGTLDRADWRRQQVDRLVEALHRTVHAIKPELRLGISPFGIGKPALRPPGIVGFSQYDMLYADVERWLDKGWLDYLAPQLYWPIERAGQEFGVLLDYWLAQNPRRRHIWPGLYTSMVGATHGSGTNTQPWPASEVLQQIERVRARAGPLGSGHLHFSMAALLQDRDGIATWLRAGPYSQPALVPATPWLKPSNPWRGPSSPWPGTALPPAPMLRRTPAGAIAITPANVTGTGSAAFVWSVWRRRAAEWRFEVHPASGPVALAGNDQMLVVRAVDALGNEGPAAVSRSW